MSDLSLSVQYCASDLALPSRYLVRRLVKAALANSECGDNGGEVTVRFVSSAEMQEVGRQHHHQQTADILSFAYHAPLSLTDAENLTSNNSKTSKPTAIVGDIMVCAEVAAKTATKHKRCLPDHLSHLIVHGALHLAGYTHKNNTDADKMESIERRVLAQFGIADPYIASN